MNDIIIHNLIEQLDRIESKIDNRVLKNWLSINDVVQTVGNSKSTINRAIKNGELESVKNGGKRMFRKEWVDRWISG
jgi:excisionase family DNA binding protein